MNKDSIEKAKHRFTQAKKPEPPRNKPTYLDGVKVIDRPKDKQPVELYYDKYAKLTDDKVGALAKQVAHTSGAKDFYARYGTAGAGVGHLLNPWGPFYRDDDEHTYEKNMGRYRYEFRQVSQEIFENYMRFLETRNDRYLLVAERLSNDAR